MAAVGDVLVKFVANFAEFSKGMDDANKQLVEFGAKAQETNQKIASSVGFLKFDTIAKDIKQVIDAVIAYGEQLQKNAVDTANLAQKSKLTTDQIQALQGVAKETGRSLDDLIKIGQQNADWLKKVEDNARSAGQILGSETIQKFKDMADESDRASRSMEILFSPLYALAKSTAVTTLNSVVQYFAQLARIVNEWNLPNWEKILAFFVNPGAVIGTAIGQQISGVTPLTQRLAELKALDAEIEKSTALIDKYAQSNSTAAASDQAVERQRRAALERQRDEVRQRIQQLASTPTPLQPIEVPALKVPGGGGGGTDDDTIDRQIARYTALLASAQKAAEAIAAGHGRYIDDLTREVRVQQQVDDIVAKIVARGHGIPKKEDIDRLTEVVTLEQQRRDENAKQLQYLATADQLEQKLGDGARARALAQRDQQRIRETGLASPEAQARNAKQTEESLDAQARAASRYDDSLESLANGFLNAAAASARAHDLFSTGTEAFNALTGAMGEGIDALVGRSNKGFAQIASDFALMIAKMTATAALNQVFQYLIKAAGIALANYFAGDPNANASGFAPGGGPQGPSGGAVVPRAGGGQVYGGSPYLVGERGPELFVPSAAGNIVPNHSLASGGGVTVNIDMGQTTGAANPTQALDFGRKVRAAVVAVIANEKRPGGSLHPATA